VTLTVAVAVAPKDLARALYLRRVPAAGIASALGGIGNERCPGWALYQSDTPTAEIASAYAKADPDGAAKEEARHAAWLVEYEAAKRWERVYYRMRAPLHRPNVQLWLKHPHLCAGREAYVPFLSLSLIGFYFLDFMPFVHIAAGLRQIERERQFEEACAKQRAETMERVRRLTQEDISVILEYYADEDARPDDPPLLGVLRALKGVARAARMLGGVCTDAMHGDRCFSCGGCQLITALAACPEEV
jgi:hypothetical protein